MVDGNLNMPNLSLHLPNLLQVFISVCFAIIRSATALKMGPPTSVGTLLYLVVLFLCVGLSSFGPYRADFLIQIYWFVL